MDGQCAFEVEDVIVRQHERQLGQKPLVIGYYLHMRRAFVSTCYIRANGDTGARTEHGVCTNTKPRER